MCADKRPLFEVAPFRDRRGTGWSDLLDHIKKYRKMTGTRKAAEPVIRYLQDRTDGNLSHTITLY